MSLFTFCQWLVGFNLSVAASLIINLNWLTFACCVRLKLLPFNVLTEKLSQAKEENLGMHQMLDQTLMELNNLWKHSLTPKALWFWLFVLAPCFTINPSSHTLAMVEMKRPDAFPIAPSCLQQNSTNKRSSGEVTLNHSLWWSLNWETRLFSQATRF